MGHCVIVPKKKKSILCKMTLAVIKQRRIAETFHKLLPRETKISMTLMKTLSNRLL